MTGDQIAVLKTLYSTDSREHYISFTNFPNDESCVFDNGVLTSDYVERIPRSFEPSETAVIVFRYHLWFPFFVSFDFTGCSI